MEAKTWEDTVMTLEDVLAKLRELPEDGWLEVLGDMHTYERGLQAEISFKAGLEINDTRATAAEIAGDALEERCDELGKELALSRAEAEGCLSQLLDVQQDCIQAKKAGRMEVVELANELSACILILQEELDKRCITIPKFWSKPLDSYFIEKTIEKAKEWQALERGVDKPKK